MIAPQMTEAEWRKFHNAITPDGSCLLWKPRQSKETYPRFYVRGGQHCARRIAYEAAVGEFEERFLRATCRNSKCVNALHMKPAAEASGGFTSQDDLERFMSKVDKTIPSPPHLQGRGPCWGWTGPLNREGYGSFNLRGRATLAHRVIPAIMGEPIPDGVLADHECYRRNCVNPGHTRPSSHIENSQNRCLENVVSSTGVRGVSRTASGRYRAVATTAGAQHYLGTFDSIEDAGTAVKAFRRDHMPSSLMDQLEGVA